MQKKTFYLVLLCLSFLGINAQKLSRTEKKIIKSIEANNDDAISFLEKVVNINSGTLNLVGVEEVGKVFSDAFKDIGFKTSWIPMPSEMNRAGHLFAEINGAKGKKLLLIGHLDTVFEAVSYTHLRAHETVLDIVCRLLLEKKN